MSETTNTTAGEKKARLLENIKQLITSRMNEDEDEDDDEKNTPGIPALSTEREQVSITDKVSKIHKNQPENEVKLDSLIGNLT